jgi:hypothetical protein
MQTFWQSSASAMGTWTTRVAHARKCRQSRVARTGLRQVVLGWVDVEAAVADPPSC